MLEVVLFQHILWRWSLHLPFFHRAFDPGKSPRASLIPMICTISPLVFQQRRCDCCKLRGAGQCREEEFTCLYYSHRDKFETDLERLTFIEFLEITGFFGIPTEVKIRNDGHVARCLETEEEEGRAKNWVLVKNDAHLRPSPDSVLFYFVGVTISSPFSLKKQTDSIP